MSDFIGKIIKGRVCGITNYGIFVDLENGYFGLIHISEVSDSYVKNLNDYVKLNQVINVKVIDVNEDEHKCRLSIKNINYDLEKDNDKFFQSEINGFRSLESKINEWINLKLKEYNLK